MKNNENTDKRLTNIQRIINMVPGTLVYKGVKKEPFRIERISFNKNKYATNVYESCNEAFIYAINQTNQDMIHWINVTGINNTVEIQKIGKLFEIDILLLEQIVTITKHSTYKNTEKYLFNDIQMVYINQHQFTHENMSIFLKDNIIITFQERKGDIFDSLRERIANNYGNIRNNHVEYTYFCLVDALVDHYMYVLEQMKTDIDLMEEAFIDSQALNNQDLHRLRKQILTIRLSAGPLEKMIQELMVNQPEEWERYRAYFESLANHIRMVMNELILQKESIDSLYENYMMTNANEMNRVMTILTIFSAIFIPLSFFAGVFGMNFAYIPGLNHLGSFYYFIGGCFAMAAIMVGYFKWKKWF